MHSLNRTTAGCEIIGVEITDAANAVNTHPFHGNTAFMLGNEVRQQHQHASWGHAHPQHRCNVALTLLLAVQAPQTSSHSLQGTGLSEHQLKLCDSFVYIPQHGHGTASLNVTVAASIVLHHFAIWAGYQECSRHGAKYDVASPPLRTAARGM